MNLIVASIAFYHYNKAGFHLPRLTIPFIIASIPTAFLGGYVSIDPELYDILLSITLLWAAYKVVNYTEINNAKLKYKNEKRIEKQNKKLSGKGRLYKREFF